MSINPLFLEKLAETRGRVKWVRGKKKGDSCIRGRIRRGPYAGEMVCPVTCVTYFTTGMFYSCGNPWMANSYLNKQFRVDLVHVVTAADSDLTMPIYAEARKELLSALGFKVAPPND